MLKSMVRLTQPADDERLSVIVMVRLSDRTAHHTSLRSHSPGSYFGGDLGPGLSLDAGLPLSVFPFPPRPITFALSNNLAITTVGIESGGAASNERPELLPRK